MGIPMNIKRIFCVEANDITNYDYLKQHVDYQTASRKKLLIPTFKLDIDVGIPSQVTCLESLTDGL